MGTCKKACFKQILSAFLKALQSGRINVNMYQTLHDQQAAQTAIITFIPAATVDVIYAMIDYAYIA
eukprot:523586-Pelagomonas_calceolata.AAC.3